MAWRVVFSLRCIRCLAAAAAAFLAPLTIWAEEQAASPRVDLYGDPLPEGAIARLGSTRFSNSVKSPIRACTYTPDGRQIASITSDGKLQFWDRSSGYETRELEVDRPAPHEPRAPIDDRAFRRDVNIAIAPDGNLVAIAWWGRGRIEIRELRAGNSVASITTRRRSPARAPSLVFSSDGRRLIAVEAGQLEIFDLKGEPVGPPLPPRSRIAISQTRDVMLTKDDVKITTTPTRLELRDGATGGLQRELDAVDGAELMSGIAINARATKFAAAFGK
ncbi:MAG TPA: WD40 repeat domain-containing protein, partial [Gammaproteobacteria bacterium]|nr:WD40 repeat domain-containing protein [Gammaproteobacteria bacterium]